MWVTASHLKLEYKSLRPKPFFGSRGQITHPLLYPHKAGLSKALASQEMIVHIPLCQLSKPFQILTVREEPKRGTGYPSSFTRANWQTMQAGGSGIAWILKVPGYT